MKIVLLEDVFTPSSPAQVNYINRTHSEKQFRRALKTTGKQIIVYGHSGSGKSTLILKLLEEQGYNYITTRCTKELTIRNILYDAFSQLNTFYTTQFNEGSDKTLKAKIKGGIPGLFSGSASGSSTTSDREIIKRVVEIQKNPHQLAKDFGELNNLWVIEDFHKLNTDSKKSLSQIMKVFMDVSHKYKNSKIIAVGAVDTARQVVIYDAEMDNRVSEVAVPLMNNDEIRAIIDSGEDILNFEMPEEIKNKIIAYSCGLASVTHQLCFLICESKRIDKTQYRVKKIDSRDLDYAINEYLSEKSDSLRLVYELAIKDRNIRKFDSSKEILIAALKLGQETFSIKEIKKELKNKYNDYRGSNLRNLVNKLTSADKGEIFRYNRNADTYSFTNPFVKGYCHIQLLKQPKEKLSKVLEKESENLKSYLLVAYQQFLRDMEEDTSFIDITE